MARRGIERWGSPASPEQEGAEADCGGRPGDSARRLPRQQVGRSTATVFAAFFRALVAGFLAAVLKERACSSCSGYAQRLGLDETLDAIWVPSDSFGDCLDTVDIGESMVLIDISLPVWTLSKEYSKEPNGIQIVSNVLPSQTAAAHIQSNCCTHVSSGRPSRR